MEAMEAPTPISDEYQENIKSISIPIKLNNENYNINIGIFKEFLVIKAKNELNFKNNYCSSFTHDDLRKISNSFKYFENLNEIMSFMEEKGKNNEIFTKIQNDILILEFKIISPNGKENEVAFQIKPKDMSDKEIISFLVKKVEYLEKEVNDLKYLKQEVKTLKEKINGYENTISQNKKYISSLSEKINQLINKFDKKEDKFIDSKIININEINFIINRLKESPIINNKNFQFKLLYRGTRDGDDTKKVHEICDKKQNIIIFMRSEQGNKFGGFSHIGWENRSDDKSEYPIDNNAFLFSFDTKEIFNAKKGKAKISWINSNVFGLCFWCSLSFRNKFFTERNSKINSLISSYYEKCSKDEFNSGISDFKLSELEIFQII